MEKTKDQPQMELAQLRRQRAQEKAAESICFEVLSMRSRDDLLKVAVMMFRELERLGIKSPACVFFTSSTASIASIRIWDQSGP